MMNEHCLHDEVFLGGRLLTNILSAWLAILSVITKTRRIDQRPASGEVFWLINHVGDN